MVAFAPPPDFPPSPQGAAGGLFAPAHIPGNAQSQAALEEWSARHRHLTRAEIESLRMPPLAQRQTGNPRLPGGGGLVAQGDPLGEVDPAALQAAAQGTPYDIEARRNAIAARLAENAALAAQGAPQAGPAGFTRGSVPAPAARGFTRGSVPTVVTRPTGAK